MNMGTGRCKTYHAGKSYGAARINERLLRHSTGDSGKQKEYHRLARWFNIILLRRKVYSACMTCLGDKVDVQDDRLQGHDETTVSEVEESLASEGVTTNGLKSDFVSYDVIRNHLKERLGAERGSSDTDWGAETLAITKEYSKQKAENATNSLINKGKTETEEGVTVDVDIRFENSACQTRVRLARALQQGQVCNCANNEVAVV